MTLYELVTRPLTHRWVAINRTTERVVTEDWHTVAATAIEARAEHARWLAAVTTDPPVKTKRAYTPRKPKVQS